MFDKLMSIDTAVKGPEVMEARPKSKARNRLTESHVYDHGYELARRTFINLWKNEYGYGGKLEEMYEVREKVLQAACIRHAWLGI